MVRLERFRRVDAAPEYLLLQVLAGELAGGPLIKPLGLLPMLRHRRAVPEHLGDLPPTVLKGLGRQRRLGPRLKFRRQVLGIEPDRRLKVLGALLVVAVANPYDGSPLVVVGRVGLELVGRVEVRDGLRRVALPVVDPTSAKIAASVFWLQPNGFRIVGDGLVPIALYAVGVAAVVVGTGFFRVEPNGFGAVGDGLVVIALGPVGGAPTPIGIGKLRIEPNGLRIVGDGLVLIALVLIGRARA